MYKVVKRFTDLRDNNYLYAVGDTYPRKGVDIDSNRVEVLASNRNKLGVPLIVEIPKIPPLPVEPVKKASGGKKKKTEE